MSVDPQKIDLLLVDDDPDFRESVARRFMRRGFQVQEAAHGEQALQLAGLREFDVIVLDMVMPGLSGMQVLEQLKLTQPECEIIMLTGQGTIETAVQAMKLGAYDFLQKPFPLAELEVLIEKAYERRQLRKENEQLKAVLKRAEKPISIIGESPAMKEVFRLIERAGPTDKSILIQGESGTGKELVAKALQQASVRANKPMVTINCAALPEALLESELFGHEKGSFTGAVATKQGLFEVADGGTLFIDEIGEIAGSLQAKLLRVLEDGSLRRVGSLKERRVDVRLLAATQSRHGQGSGRRPLSRGSVLPHQRDVAAIAAAARAARRHSAFGATPVGRPVDDRSRCHAGHRSLSVAGQRAAVDELLGTRPDHGRWHADSLARLASRHRFRKRPASEARGGGARRRSTGRRAASAHRGRICAASAATRRARHAPWA